MRIGYTEEQEALRQELRGGYYAEMLTPHVEADLATSSGIGPTVRRLVRQMPPTAGSGSGGRPSTGGRAGRRWSSSSSSTSRCAPALPCRWLTINTVGRHVDGASAPRSRKPEFLPRILAGEIHFCIGYTEPNAGTGPGGRSPPRRCVTATEYVINGAKIYTSLAGGADYIWLAHAAPIPRSPSTRASRCSSCRWTPPGIRSCPCTSWARTTSTTPSTRTCGSRPRTSSVARTMVGRSSRTSSTTSGSPCARRASSTAPSPTCGRGRSRPSCPTGAGSSTSSGSRALARVRAELEYLRPHQLEGCLAGHPGPSRRGGRVLHQGLRHRVLPAGLPPAHGGHRTGRLPPAGTRRGPVLAGRLEMYARSMIILTFGGGDQRDPADLIAIFGLGMPRSLR